MIYEELDGPTHEADINCIKQWTLKTVEYIQANKVTTTMLFECANN